MRRVPFWGLRGLMHWNTNVLKRPRRWRWTTITPRPERKQVWTLLLSVYLSALFYFFKPYYIVRTTEAVKYFWLLKVSFLCFFLHTCNLNISKPVKWICTEHLAERFKLSTEQCSSFSSTASCHIRVESCFKILTYQLHQSQHTYGYALLQITLLI